MCLAACVADRVGPSGRGADTTGIHPGKLAEVSGPARITQLQRVQRYWGIQPGKARARRPTWMVPSSSIMYRPVMSPSSSVVSRTAGSLKVKVAVPLEPSFDLRHARTC